MVNEVIGLSGTRVVDPTTGETTITIEVGGQPVKFILLSDERREGLRVELAGGLTIGREVQHGTNGETRERIRFPSGAGCIRTITSGSGWQRAHSHREVRESFAVQAGRLCFVELGDEGVLYARIYGAGEEFQTTPGKAHNLYVFAGADFLTMKHGGGAKDWIASPELDALTEPLDEVAILDRFSR